MEYNARYSTSMVCQIKTRLKDDTRFKRLSSLLFHQKVADLFLTSECSDVTPQVKHMVEYELNKMGIEYSSESMRKDVHSLVHEICIELYNSFQRALKECDPYQQWIKCLEYLYGSLTEGLMLPHHNFFSFNHLSCMLKDDTRKAVERTIYLRGGRSINLANLDLYCLIARRLAHILGWEVYRLMLEMLPIDRLEQALATTSSNSNNSSSTISSSSLLFQSSFKVISDQQQDGEDKGKIKKRLVILVEEILCRQGEYYLVHEDEKKKKAAKEEDEEGKEQQAELACEVEDGDEAANKENNRVISSIQQAIIATTSSSC